MLALIRKKYRETLIIAGGFDRGTAEAWLEQGKADLIAFGRKFLANPDLPDRFRARKPLNADDPATYYGGGATGYTDYPSLAQERASNRKPASTIDGDSSQRPLGLRLLLPVELPEKYGRSAATGIASAQNLTHLKRR